MSDFWDIVLEPYSNDPAAAFMLAQNFSILKQKIQTNPSEAVSTLDEAIEKLYPYTQAHSAAYQLFLLAIQGKLSPEHDPIKIAKKACG
jgi:hypothetical protein